MLRKEFMINYMVIVDETAQNEPPRLSFDVSAGGEGVGDLRCVRRIHPSA